MSKDHPVLDLPLKVGVVPLFDLACLGCRQYLVGRNGDSINCDRSPPFEKKMQLFSDSPTPKSSRDDHLSTHVPCPKEIHNRDSLPIPPDLDGAPPLLS